MTSITRTLSTIVLVLLLAAILPACTPESPNGGQDQPPPPVMVPVVPNESIVTARIIAVNNVEGPFSWELVIEILSAENVPGYQNLLADRKGETIAVLTEENMGGYGKDDIISARISYEGDERTRFYSGREIASAD